jgi:hypothetical protein
MNLSACSINTRAENFASLHISISTRYDENMQHRELPLSTTSSCEEYTQALSSRRDMRIQYGRAYKRRSRA